MKQYLELCQKVLDKGTLKSNRTGTNTIGYHGDMMKFDLADGFPIVTTKAINYDGCFAEMLGFLRGYDNAADFRKLGCKWWDANANENKDWLANPERRGTDDLGAIYGVQARTWDDALDQLGGVYRKLCDGIDDRRLIVSHWNPAELYTMALPPCHVLYQFGLDDDRLNLSMYQRSCDVPLGIPMNISGYAWLLVTMAHITGHIPGVLTHFMHDIHIYKGQIEGIKEQLTRKPYKLPILHVSDKIKTLEHLESWVTTDHFVLSGYYHDDAIKFPFSV